MTSPLLDGVLKVEFHIGPLETLGVVPLEKMDLLESKEVLMKFKLRLIVHGVQLLIPGLMT